METASLNENSVLENVDETTTKDMNNKDDIKNYITDV